MPTTISATDLTARIAAILAAAGSSADEAQAVAANLVLANLSGHDSHGVGMAPRYVDAVLEGGLKPNTGVRTVLDTGTLLTLDGQRGYGQIVGAQAMALGMARARQHGSCIMTLANAHHLGRIGHFAEMAVAQGLVSQRTVPGIGEDGLGLIEPLVKREIVLRSAAPFANRGERVKIAVCHDAPPLETREVFVVAGVAQAALEHEAGFGHLDHQQTARSIVYFPARMEPFEREIGEGIECRGKLHGRLAGRFARDLVFERSDSHLGARNGVHIGVEAFAFLNRAAITAAIEAHLDPGDAGCAKRANHGLLQMLGLGLGLQGAFGLPLMIIRHYLSHIDHWKILLCWRSGGQSTCHHWHRRGPLLWPDNASAAGALARRPFGRQSVDSDGAFGLVPSGPRRSTTVIRRDRSSMTRRSSTPLPGNATT